MTARDVLIQNGHSFGDELSEADLALAVQNFRTPEQIEELEAFMLEHEQTEVPVEHYFSKGTYTRKIKLLKGNFAIGHSHRDNCLNIVLSGSASVLIDGEVRRITAPFVFEGKALERKVGYIHEDCIWMTVHATDETDLAKLEELLLIKSEAFKAYERQRGNREDFFKALRDLEISAEEVRSISENEADQMDFPSEFAGRVNVRASEIQGLGLFALRPFSAGVVIAPARIRDKRTPAGRFTNHAVQPNAFMQESDTLDMIKLVCLRPIAPGEEITVDYRKARQTALKADSLLLT